MTDATLLLAVECRRVVGRHLRTVYTTTPLSRDQLASAYPTRNFSSGWRLSDLDVDGKRHLLDICLTEEYPFAAPRLALPGAPVFLTWPHVELDGVLCLLTEQTTIDPLQPIAVVEDLIRSARELIVASAANLNEEDFRDEFLTYWSYGVESSSPSVKSLLQASSKSRFVSCLCTTSYTFVAETDSQLASWLSNLRSKMTSSKRFVRGLLVICAQALLPSEYPSDARDLLRIVQENGTHRQLVVLAAANAPAIPIFLQMQTKAGKCLAAVTLVQVRPKDFFGHVAQTVGRGFRPGKTPPLLAARQYLSSSRVFRSSVERVDHEWVHGRDMDRCQEVLKEAKVLIIGCGSVGGFVAQQLAMAGVGSMNIIDPQRLSSANVGRHLLGMASLGKSKAIETAKAIQVNYPHLSVAGHSTDWQTFRKGHQTEWSDAQLILSLTGDWQSESLLNAEHVQSRKDRDVLYGWTEPHACAGHAVLIGSKGGCFACQMDNLGKAKRTLSLWNTSTHQTEPACGATFQPYGPVELSGTVNLISSLALEALLRPKGASVHHMWVGSTQLLEENSGKWNDELFRDLDISGRENLRASIPWEVHEQCSYCGGSSV
jgi:molybdopterin/thiamine biosynthesis adenylyltransferase